MGRENRNAYILNFPEAKNLLRNTGNFIMENGRGWYNCGGFALGRPEWYLPYNDEVDDECYYIREDCDCNNITREECCTKIGRLYVDYMCATEEVREICTHAELREDEYLVLFKASYDDFHYVRQMDDGRWFHKNGSDFIQIITDDEAYSDEWWYDLPCHYDGELFMLAVKKPNHKKNRIFRKQTKVLKNNMRNRKRVIYGGQF